jgi:hypothetical protein
MRGIRRGSSPYDTRYAPPLVPPSAGPSAHGASQGVPQSISARTAACEATKKATARKIVLEPALAIASGTVDSPIVLDHVSNSVSEAKPDACVDASSDARLSITDRALDACADSTESTTRNGSRAGASVDGNHLSRRKTCCARRCKGILVEFPHGRNHHISYPFGIHCERDIPWDYHSTSDKFYLQAKLCREPSVSEGSACKDCRALMSIPLYIGIMDRIRNGVHENTPLIYHGVGGLVEVTRRKTEQVRQLRLTKLNASRQLLGKATALDDHKQWMMAIASGQVNRVASLVQAGLKNKARIKTLIHQYGHVAEKLYQPKGYSNKDLMCSIVMLRLGGARVAEFAHCSLSLPSIVAV